MSPSKSPQDLEALNEQRRRSWAKQAPKYDKSIGFFERRVFGPGHRSWACGKAEGETLEVAVGTGLNLPLYGSSVSLTGIDLSPEMLAIARRRAAELDPDFRLEEGDAHALAFPENTFDTVISTYSLCNIPDPHVAVGEMKRVLRPGGKLILVDHIRSGFKPVFWAQKLIEVFTIRVDGDHMTRRPLEQVREHGFTVLERERLGPTGIIEGILATTQA
jgi:ubiquinone/menaquinone biosynthesis C-methylase UbiE